MSAALQWAAEKDGEIFVFTENRKILDAWCWVNSVWRTGGMGGIIGLDWPSVRVLLKSAKIKMTPHLVSGLQIMEQSALREFARHRKARQ